MTSTSTSSSPADGPRGCWVCGSTDIAPWKARSFARALVPDDLRISDARYGQTLSLLRCRSCGLVFADDAEIGELEALYSALDDPGYEESLPARQAQMAWLLETALAAVPGARTALDIGAGAGLLVREAQSRGLVAVGIEPSHALVRSAWALHGIELLQGTFPHPQTDGRTFDIVFLVDVIEHVTDPVALMRAARGALAPGGIVVLVTPDLRSIAARALRKRWWHFRVAHVSYFDQHTLGLAAKAAGLAPLSWHRARWFLPIGYLVERIGSYVPIGGLTRLSTRSGAVRKLFARTIPLDLRDSWVLVLAESR